MSALTTGEVMEALAVMVEAARTELALYDRSEVEIIADCDRRRRTLELLMKYAPEMVQREAEEAAGERKVRLTLTTGEALQTQLGLALLTGPVGRVARTSANDKLDAALKSLDPPEMLERADREDEG